MLKKYQGSMRGLGGFCIFALCLCVIVAIVQANGIGPAADVEERLGMIIILSMLGLIWLFLGVFCFLMKNWTAYAVGALSILNCVGSVAQTNVGGAVFAGAVAWASFSAAAKGRELKGRGISLNRKWSTAIPDDAGRQIEKSLKDLQT